MKKIFIVLLLIIGSFSLFSQELIKPISEIEFYDLVLDMFDINMWGDEKTNKDTEEMLQTVKDTFPDMTENQVKIFSEISLIQNLLSQKLTKIDSTKVLNTSGTKFIYNVETIVEPQISATAILMDRLKQGYQFLVKVESNVSESFRNNTYLTTLGLCVGYNCAAYITDPYVIDSNGKPLVCLEYAIFYMKNDDLWCNLYSFILPN